MCARRFLILVFILILLVVGAAFAIFQFGDRILLRSAVPSGHFRPPPPASGPDYSQAESWLAHPGASDDSSRWLPAGASPSSASPGAAIFYVHPTTYLLRDRWNAPLRGSADSDARAELFVRSQASAFTSAGEVWAPRYRQAAFGAFLLTSGDAEKALDLAYGDVAAAFDRFLAEAGDRPIVLAGHSQGSLHLSRLLRERSAGLKGRLVAAYVVGWPISRSAYLAPIGLTACATPGQAGCVLSWQSFREPANPDLMLKAWEKSRGPTGIRRRRADMVCVNPLTGSDRGSAPPGANPGTLVPTGDLTAAGLVPQRVGAHCDKGLLVLDGEVPNLGPYVLPGNNYHVYDYALFWGAIRGDAARRLAAWRR